MQIPYQLRRMIVAVLSDVLKFSASYDSGWFAVGANTAYTKTHGLNRQPTNVTVFFSTAATGGAESRQQGITTIPGTPTVYYGNVIYNITTTALTVMTGDKTGLDSSNQWQTTGYYRVLVWG